MKKMVVFMFVMLAFYSFLFAQEAVKVQTPFGNNRRSQAQPPVADQKSLNDKIQEPVPSQMIHQPHQQLPVCPLPPPDFSKVPSASDWEAAWQGARDSKIFANKVVFYLSSASGPSITSGEKNIFEVVSLKAFGEVLMITAEKTQTSEEIIMLIKGNELQRIEIQKVK